jgi:hypothetical protein
MHLGALGFLLAGAIVLATQTAAETQSVTAGVINRLPGEAALLHKSREGFIS